MSRTRKCGIVRRRCKTRVAEVPNGDLVRSPRISAGLKDPLKTIVCVRGSDRGRLNGAPKWEGQEWSHTYRDVVSGLYAEMRKGIQYVQFPAPNTVRKAISSTPFESLCKTYVQMRGDIPGENGRRVVNCSINLDEAQAGWWFPVWDPNTTWYMIWRKDWGCAERGPVAFARVSFATLGYINVGLWSPSHLFYGQIIRIELEQSYITRRV